MNSVFTYEQKLITERGANHRFYSTRMGVQTQYAPPYALKPDGHTHNKKAQQ